MYCQFYGFESRPFDLTTNPPCFVMTPGHEEALGNLEYSSMASSGVTLLLGEAGTGKTSLLRKAFGASIDGASTGSGVLYIDNPTLSVGELMETLAHAFDLTPWRMSSKAQLLRELDQTLRRSQAAGTPGTLVIDEAQSLPDALLEEIRLLANLESRSGRLLRIVLAGQPALARRLNRPELAQLKQRIDLRCIVPALDPRQTSYYIARRISSVGGKPAHVFSREAVRAIHEQSQGIPRTINVLCANALLTGFAIGQRPVDSTTVLNVCADFDLVRTPVAVTTRAGGHGRAPADVAGPPQPLSPSFVGRSR